MFSVAQASAFNLETLDNGVLVGTVRDGSALPWHGTKNSSIALFAPNLGAFYETLRTRFSTPRGGQSSAKVGKEGGWRFFGGYEEALNTYEKTPEKIREFQAKEDDLQARMEQGATMTYDVVGDVLDVGLYLEGDPEAWGSLTFGNPRGLYAHILVNLVSSASVKGPVISHRNQRLVRLVDWLEHNRIRTRVHVMEITSEDVIEIRIKDFHDVFDLNAIAAATHLDFFRRLCFRVHEYSNTHDSWTYGQPMTIYQGRMDKPPLPTDEGMIALYSEIQSDQKLIDKQFDEAESYITATYSDAFTGEDYGRSHDHHDAATGVPGGSNTTKLVWS